MNDYSELKENLKIWQTVIDEGLNRVLPQTNEPPALLHKAMRYAVFSGGKRLRPVLGLLAAGACGADMQDERIIKTVLAVEILHTYTLIHDDLPSMDDDDERRGKPTCHKVFGEAVAILAGDALQALAFDLAANAPCHPSAAVRTLAKAAGSLGVVGGQVADITLQNPSNDDVHFVHLHKTADLFKAAILIGALAADAPAKQQQALETFAVNLGLAFQIIDDILDAADGETGEFSCIALYGMEEARQKAAELTAAALDALHGFSGEAAQDLKNIAKYMLERTY